MSEQNSDHSPRKVGGDDQQSVPASQPLRQLLDIAVANAQSLGLWLLLPLGGFIVLVYAAADGGEEAGGLHVVTGLLTLLISLVVACVLLMPRVKEVQRSWLVLPLAGAVVFLYFVNRGLNDPWGGSSWWIGLLIFAVTIYVALTPQIHSFSWTNLGAVPMEAAGSGQPTVLDAYSVRMRAIARLAARTITLSAIAIVIAGAGGGYALGAELGDALGFEDGARAVGTAVGVVGGVVIAQFWLGFASIVWFVADIALHARVGTGVVRPDSNQSSSTADAPVGDPS